MRCAMRLAGESSEHPLTVKDLSASGMKVTAPVAMRPGTQIEVCLPHIGWVTGEVLRTEGANVLGIRFELLIEPERTQVRVSGRYGPTPLPTPQRRV